jgi:hypothetical protein
MQSAGTVLAKFAVPAIAIPRHPGIEMLRGKVNPGDEKKPGDQLPPGQREPYARPSVSSGVNAPCRIDGLHQAHRFVEIYLRKARGYAGIVQVQQFDPGARVHASHAGHAGAAQVAGPIVKHR